jgi:leucyl-tRNA synthetase
MAERPFPGIHLRANMDTPYDPHRIEREAQAHWERHASFRTPDSDPRPKFYCLAMFPYPSGQLHMGHVRCYTLADVIGRFQRLKGRNVLQPMGWDAFGLPAENAAIKHGVPPATWTYANIDHMRGQMQALGFAIDWSREFATCDPEYYRWEQWFFTRLMQKGLVYRKSSWVNWDPVDQTVLANEQVVDGRGWRSGALVERREMPQWFLKISAYADELLEQLDHLPDWPEQVKTMQRNWIGRSEGVEIDFAVVGSEELLTVYTTRPDTLLGATYVALAPQHPLATEAAADDAELADFIDRCSHVKAAEAEIATMEKLGHRTRRRVRHPLTGAELPVWVANFVLMEYGSGAVMSVPGHDQRDWEFARRYGIEIRQVIEPVNHSDVDVRCDLAREAYVEKGRLVNSGEFSGLSSEDAFAAIADALVAKGLGRRRTNYRLRDWGISRQRYWGCPIPVIYCDRCGPQPVPDQDLPVLLPTDVQFQGVASPLKTMESFRRTRCPRCGGAAERETDTFDTFVESSWYYARFASSDSNSPMVDERVDDWTPVDHYVGGIEHAILHLLYARFFHKLMRDEGLLHSDEPFQQLLMLGMVLKDGKKMSKSAGDAGDPQHLLEKYGADAVRVAMMFSAPPEQSFEWSENGVEGAARFLRRLVALVESHVRVGATPPLAPDMLDDDARALRRKTHETLARAEDDYGRRIQFNTVVAAVMELINAVARCGGDSPQTRAAVHEALSTAVLALSPIAPHAAHHCWRMLGHTEPVHAVEWPRIDEAALVRAELEIAVQVNGKLRGRITIRADAEEAQVREHALANENVARFVDGKSFRKVIYVPGKLLNLVVG